MSQTRPRHTLAALLLSSTLGVAAHAQDLSTVPDEVVSTGTLIRGSSQDFESPSPIQTVDELDIANTGAVRLQDLFKGLTVNSGSQIANRQNALQGVSQFSLRGLGIGSTLTLVNGRRAGLSPVTDSTGQLFTDANAYPVNMIERIDVLTDGASATYGSEAVAGVVNVITRKDLDGLELTAEYRNSTHDSYQLGGAFGKTFAGGSASVFVNYIDQGGNFRGDFDFIRERDAANERDGVPFGAVFNSGTGSPGRFQRATADGAGGFERTGNTLADPDCAAVGGILRGSACRYNFINQRRLIAEEDRLQIFSQFDTEVGDRIDLFAEASFSRNEIRDALGGGVLRRTQFDGGFLVPGSNPYNFFVSDGADGIVYAGPEAFAADPTLEAVDVIYRGRPLGAAYDGDCEGGDDVLCAEDIVTTFDNLRFAVGADIDIGRGFVLSTSYVNSDNSYDRSQPRDYSSELFQQAILDGVFNPFGSSLATPNAVSPKDGVSVFGNSQADIDSFALTINEVGSVRQEVAEAIVSGFTGLDLGGGEIGIAVGGQYRQLGYEFTPDSRRQDGTNARGEVEAAIPLTQQDVYAVFGELAVPITDTIETQFAIRYEDYGDRGGDTVDPKFSAKWDITPDLALRGSYGTSFQAPSIRQVAGAVGSAGVEDPLAPDAGTFNVTVFTSGSPDLTPASASNLNLGGVYRNDIGLDVALDYWTYDYDDLILPGGSPQAILDADPNGPNILRDPSGQINAVFTGFENRGGAEAEGLDLNMRLRPRGWNITDLLALDANATLVTKFRSDEFDGLDGEGDLKGSRNFANAFGSVPDLKANFGVTVGDGIHTGNVTVRYVSSYTDDQNGEDIDSYTTVDARYAIDLDDVTGGFIDNEGTKLTVGLVNVFDEEPPQIAARPLFDTEVGDPRGRQFYVGLKQNF